MIYITVAEFLKRYDTRVLGQLITDYGVQIGSTDILTNANLQAALNDAEGLLNSALLVAQKYAVTDLQALTGSDQAFLFRIISDLAYGYLLQRRGMETKDVPQYQDALNLLQLLRNGERVFNVIANEQAGLVSQGFPSIQTITNRNYLRDVASPRFFPGRREQFPIK